MLSKAEILVLRYLKKYGESLIVGDHPPAKLSRVKNLPDVLKRLKKLEYIEEIGSKKVTIPHIGAFYDATDQYKILPAGVAELEFIPIDIRRMWIPVILSTVLSIFAIVISIIALLKP